MVVFGLGLILGCWITYLAPAMGSNELATALVITVGMIAIGLWDLRKLSQRKNRPSR